MASCNANGRLAHEAQEWSRKSSEETFFFHSQNDELHHRCHPPARRDGDQGVQAMGRSNGPHLGSFQGYLFIFILAAQFL